MRSISPVSSAGNICERRASSVAERGSSAIQRHRHFIDIAPAPGFTGLERGDDRVLGGLEVPGGVLILRAIAASDVTAGAAQAQLHPRVAHLETFLAALAARPVSLDQAQVP